MSSFYSTYLRLASPPEIVHRHFQSGCEQHLDKPQDSLLWKTFSTQEQNKRPPLFSKIRTECHYDRFVQEQQSTLIPSGRSLCMQKTAPWRTYLTEHSVTSTHAQYLMSQATRPFSDGQNTGVSSNEDFDLLISITGSQRYSLFLMTREMTRDLERTPQCPAKKDTVENALWVGPTKNKKYRAQAKHCPYQ